MSDSREHLSDRALNFWTKMHREGRCGDPWGVGHWHECQALADLLFDDRQPDGIPTELEDYAMAYFGPQVAADREAKEAEREGAS